MDSDGSYETYTWCGQTRVRTTTMLEGGFQGNGGGNRVQKVVISAWGLDSSVSKAVIWY